MSNLVGSEKHRFLMASRIKARRKSFLVLDGSARALLVVRGHLLREAVRGGHSVTACAATDTSMHDIQISNLEERYRAIGVDFVKLPMQRQGTNAVRDMFALLEVWKLMCKLKPDVVLSYSVKSSLYGSLAAKVARIPNSYSAITGIGYLFMPGAEKEAVFRGVAKKAFGIALRTNSKVFFQNPDDRDLFLTLGLIRREGDAVILNGSGIDLDHFLQRPLPEGPVTFLMIARIQYHKGVSEYVQAAQIVKRSYPDAKCQLIGPFDEHPSAIPTAQVESWKRGGSVEFLGGTPDVRPYLARCHVFVLPSYREGTPRSTLEAMSVGRAVVTTDVPGCRETVVDGANGFLVPPGDARSLAHAMERFLESPDLIREMGRRSREIAEKKYDVKKVVAVMMNEMGLSV